MPESNEPSSTQPVTGDAQSEPANGVHSETGTAAPQDAVPPNFVEIYQIVKPDISPEQNTAETVPDEEPTMGASDDEEPSPSAVTFAAMMEAYDHGERNEATTLYYKYAAQRDEEEKAAKEAQELAQEDPAYEEDEEEVFDEEPSEPKPEPKPDYQFGVKIGGRPGKTVGLSEMSDLLRFKYGIGRFRFLSTEDGVIDLFKVSHSPSYLQLNHPTLYESLILPINIESFRTTRELFDEIVALLQKHVMLPNKECSLLAYWSIATWFTDYLPFLPSVVISGPASTADSLLRTLAAVCRRPILLGELSPAILRRLPIDILSPTLLIREPQLNRYTSALLNASNQPGYLFFIGDSFEELYCPKCIYVGEPSRDPRPASNSIQIDLGASVPRSRHLVPTKDQISHFQNRLLGYRLLNHDKVAAANFRVSGFRPEISLVAEALGAAIVDDVDLQRGIIDVLKDRDERSRTDRATGVNGLVLRAVLFHCHQKEQRKFVREIAATANGFYADDGESLRVSSETVGHVLKSLGLYTRRLGNAGRGLIFDKPTQSHAHKLGHSYDVLASEPSCTYCHELQASQSEEVVQGV
jgi:hypothetical protein